MVCSAAASARESAPSLLPELYGGVVANQTITVAGHEFYQQFVMLWRDRELNDRYAIAVHERPSARSGTQVWVEFAQRKVFHSGLPTARAGIRPLVERAVEIVHERVAEVEVERLLYRERDLSADEL